MCGVIVERVDKLNLGLGLLFNCFLSIKQCVYF